MQENYKDKNENAGAASNKKIKLEFSIEESSATVDFAQKKEQKSAVADKKTQVEAAPQTIKTEFEIPTQVNFAKTAESAPKPKAATAKSAPERVEAAQTVETQIFGVHTTYVPKFTEVSDTYRMADGPDAPVKETKKQTPEVIVVPYEKIDPTAEQEVEKEPPVAKVVDVSAPPEEVYEIHSTVFKFEAKPQEQTPAAPEPVVEEVAKKEEPVIKEPKNYSIPDPDLAIEMRAVSERSRETAVAATVTENVGDNTYNKGKPGVNEYTAPTQRDSFKDGRAADL